MDAFKDDDIEEIERRIDTGEFYEFISDVLDEWAGDEVEELFELLEQALSDVGVEIKYSDPEFDDDEEEEEDAEEEAEEEADDIDDFEPPEEEDI